MRLRGLVSSALAMLVAGPALADGTATVVRVFDHLVAFNLPEGFVPVHEMTEGNIHVWHALPAGETMENWTQAVSLISDKSHSNKDPSSWVSMESQKWFDACKDTFDETAYGSTDIPGTERGGYGYWVSCGTRSDNGPPRSEDQLLVAVSGPAMSLLGWTKRGPPSDKKKTRHDDDTLEPRIEAMTASIRVCPWVKGEEAPYASCLAK